jgi:tocopherol cyclase
MLQRIRNLWRPEAFHYAHRLARRGGQFEGWYYKVVDAQGRQPFVFIPGVFLGADAHAFIQVLDGRSGTSAYHRFPIESFSATPGQQDIRIADNRFTQSEIQINIADNETSAKQSIRVDLSFGPWRGWPVTALSPGVMGPYSFIPGMQCNHGITSLDHSVAGEIETERGITEYDGGRGYSEKDWGKEFPAGYVWTQSNHFDREGVCITASVADIPWLTGSFRGFLVGLLLDGELMRFTTYTGASIDRLTLSDSHLTMSLHNKATRLEIDARRTDGATLHAPYDGQMIERVAETMTSEVAVRLSKLGDDKTIFEGVGRHGCLEVQGDLQRVLGEGH